MNNIEIQLEKLGLSENERSVYMALITYGSCSVRALAAVTSINRGTVYDALNVLKDRGLVAYRHQGARQHFIAEDPSKLVDIVRHQQEDLVRVQESLQQVIPELKALYERQGGKSTVRYYEGPEGVREILVDVLQVMETAPEKDYCVYSVASVRDSGLYESFPDFTQQRIDRGIRVRTISMSPGGATRGLDARKWMHLDQEMPTYTLIYHHTCAFISLGQDGTLFGVVIKNSGLYCTQKCVFDQVWSGLPADAHAHL